MEKGIQRAARAAAGLLAVTLALAVTGCSTGGGGDDIVPARAGDRKTETLHGVAVPFRYVPAGSFQRDGESEENISVISTGYWLAETETTQELFQAVMAHNPSMYNGDQWTPPAEGETQNQRPVESVTWYAAIAFCNKLSLANGKQAVYSVKVYGVEKNWAALSYADIPTENNADWNGVTMDASKNGYRLPTEMEWMWAAMGADKTSQPNTTGYAKTYAGSTETDTTNIGNYAWYNSNSGNKAHEVGKKQANELGLKDMSGNVIEWCWDWYSGSNGNTGTVGATGELTDYIGAASGSSRVIRSSSWSSSAASCKVVTRSPISPSRVDYIPGFRFACRAE